MYGDESGRRPTSGFDSITPDGVAALAAYDPIRDNPMIHCRGSSPVRGWGAPGLATSPEREGDKVIIYHETMDTTRVVYLGLTDHPSDFERTVMGHSISTFQNGVLTVDTAMFEAGVLTNSPGWAMRSENMTMRYDCTPESTQH